ncbi:MAG TPA: hypothetical protein VNT75_05730 [Symbiobacteriaceae bacterium]|nr:hypothetical protein [Symbiobacteriaceae bacterium]
MSRRGFRTSLCVLSLTLAVAGAGCGGVRPNQPAAQEPPVSSQPKATNLRTVNDPTTLNLAQITEGMKDLANSGEGSVAARVQAVFANWKLEPFLSSVLVLEGDLNADAKNEVVAVYKDPKSVNGAGTLFVFYQKDQTWQVERPAEEILSPALYGLADLNQDGVNEIVWGSNSVGANTANTTVFVTAWAPGAFRRLPGDVSMTNARVEVKGQALVMTGNTKGGYGAGSAQRQRIDTYKWVDGALKAVDKQFTPSDFAYHRLLDGLLAEEFSKEDEARKAYADASWKPVLPAGDAVASEMRDQLTIAVGALARFRNALLLMQANTPDEYVGKLLNGTPAPFDGLGKAALGARSREAACTAAIEWVKANPDFLKALNSPRGYANPQWKGPDICSPMPNF